jgi:hypothetical protein
MSVFIISEDQARNCENVPEDLGYAEAWPVHPESRFTANNGPCATTTIESIELLRQAGFQVGLLAELPNLSIFHEFQKWVETSSDAYLNTLSAIALHSEYADGIKGVAYLGFNCESELWRMSFALEAYRFCYTRNNSRNYLWLAVNPEEPEVAEFLLAWYNQDENMKSWLQGIGCTIEDQEEEERGPIWKYP